MILLSSADTDLTELVFSLSTVLTNIWKYLLLVWQAPLGVHGAKRRHQSPEWTILSHSYRLIQGEVVWSQVLLDSLHPRCSRMSWWFPPVLRRGSSYDTPGICLVWHSCNMAEQRKTLCLDNSRQPGLPGCPSHLVVSGINISSLWFWILPLNNSEITLQRGFLSMLTWERSTKLRVW